MSDDPPRSGQMVGGTWPRWISGRFLLVLAGLAIIGGTLGSQFLVDTIGEEEVSSIAAQRSADAIRTNCENDFRFRNQYRKRAVVERRLIQVQRRANRALKRVTAEVERIGTELASIPDLRVTLERVNARLIGLESQIKILPLPDCAYPNAGAEPVRPPSDTSPDA